MTSCWSDWMLWSRMSGLQNSVRNHLQTMATEDHSPMALDPHLDEQLNDIDEFVTSELRETSANGGAKRNDFWKNPLRTESDSSEVFVDDDFAWTESRNQQVSWVINDNTYDVSGQAAQSMAHPRDDTAGVDVQVQICNLRDLYDKKRKKTRNGFEYRLENTKITIIAKATIQLQSLRVFVQRCPEAAIKTHDTIGPMELQAISKQHGISRTIVAVDLDSVYETNQGELVYWLEKADVEQRNKWELIVLLHFVDGLVANVKSKSFRITTKSSHKARKENQHRAGPCVSELLVQRICERVFPVDIDATRCFFQRPTWHVEHEFSSTIPNTVDPEVDKAAFELQQELLRLNMDSEEDRVPCLALPCGQPPTPSATVVYGRVVLRHDTPLDGERVTRHYHLDSRIRYAVEQADLAGLMKIMGKKFHLTGRGRRRANGHKSAEENFWWSCGFCFFERRKKSTVKAHVIQQVCQKSTKRKEYGLQSATPRQITRCPSYETALDSSGPYSSSSWKDTLSV